MEEMKTIIRDDTGLGFRPDYTEELTRVVRSSLSPKALKERILDYHENDIAAALELLNAEERQKVYRILDAQFLSDVFQYLEDASVYFGELTIRKKVDMLSHMDADKAVLLLRQLDRTERSSLIDLIDNDARHDILMIDSYDEDEIGSRMTNNYIEIHPGLTVREAMRELVAQAADNDNISTIYVTDEQHTFYGAIDLKDLITARDVKDLDTLITTSYPYFYAGESLEDCIERLKDYSEDSVPILDNNNRLLGVITSQDLVKVVDDEMGEDYARLAGLSSEEELNEPVHESVRKRLPWLVVLLGLGMLVSSVVGLFEGIVAQLTIVICFQSLILDMAGNVGTQSLAVTIRVLVDETLDGRQKLGLIFKETRIGFVNGLILGVISFACVGLYIFLFKQEPLLFAFSISGCIGIALLLAMAVSSTCGTVIPLFFKKIKIDPAVASGPLITTLNDLTAVLAYYGFSWLFLIRMMHLAG